jgi:molecular chaperone GrpE (heat shock protein)
MTDQSRPSLAKWPFFLGDAVLLGTAFYISAQWKGPMSLVPLSLIVFCVAAGAVLAIVPAVLEYRMEGKVAEAAALNSVVAQIQNLESIAGQIAGATSQWQNVQKGADDTAAAVKGISERMTAEVKAFAEFMQRMNDSEKNNLRVEVEKLHRAESDWLQVLVRLLDHTYALHQGALRSGQPNLIGQLSNFQNACRDAARRVGLTPFIANEAEPFDPKRHQVLEGETKPGPDSVVGETLATGYSFQGKPLRLALVRLRDNATSESAPPESMKAEPPDQQTQLPLAPAGES